MRALFLIILTAFVDTPPDYDERNWPIQGRVDIILDNLIAGKKAVPMIIVMDKGSLKPGEAIQQPPTAGQPRRPFSSRTFEEVVINVLIPAVDSTFRIRSGPPAGPGARTPGSVNVTVGCKYRPRSALREVVEGTCALDGWGASSPFPVVLR